MRFGLVQQTQNHGVDAHRFTGTRGTCMTYDSVLKRFKDYQGEKTAAALMALFTKPVAASICQEPAIAVSNGKESIRIRADLPKSSATPNFLLNGAAITSLVQDEESGAWLLEILPTAKATKVTVTILYGATTIIFPVTVVPPAIVSAKEADFTAFIKDSSAKTPKFDLNGDGVHDYLDDYIYTGNFRVKKVANGKK